MVVGWMVTSKKYSHILLFGTCDIIYIARDVINWGFWEEFIILCVLNSMAGPCKWGEEGDLTDKLRGSLYKKEAEIGAMSPSSGLSAVTRNWKNLETESPPGL